MKGSPGSEGEGEPEDPVIVSTFPATMYTNAYTFGWQSDLFAPIGRNWCIGRPSGSPEQQLGGCLRARAAAVHRDTVDRQRVPGEVHIGTTVFGALGETALEVDHQGPVAVVESAGAERALHVMPPSAIVSRDRFGKVLLGCLDTTGERQILTYGRRVVASGPMA